MEQELKRVAVLQTGKIFAILYAAVGLIMLLFFLIGLLANPRDTAAMAPMLWMLLLYPVMGFFGGILLAALYNGVAKWVGGLRFTFKEVRQETT